MNAERDQRLQNQKANYLLTFIEKSPSADEQYIIFHHQDYYLALVITSLHEIIHIVKIKPVPESTKAHAGLINYRGQLITVIDLWQILDQPSPPLHPEMTILIVKYNDHLFGLLANKIIGLWLLNVKPRPDDLKKEIIYPLISGVAYHDDMNAMVFILNPERLRKAANDLEALVEKGQLQHETE